MSEQAQSSANEPIEVKLIAAASDGFVRVTPEKCESIRKLIETVQQAAFESGRQAGLEQAAQLAGTKFGSPSTLPMQIRSLAQPAASAPVCSTCKGVKRIKKFDGVGSMTCPDCASAGSREGQPRVSTGEALDHLAHSLDHCATCNKIMELIAGPTESPLARLVAKLEEAIWFHDLWEKYSEGLTHKAETMPLSTSGEQMCMMCLRIAEHRAALAAAGGTHDKP